LPQVPPQYVFTSLTQVASHFVEQQYGSAAQIFVTHALQPETSLVPVEQSLCEHVPPVVPLLEVEEELLDEELLDVVPPQVAPQTVATSPTQVASQEEAQQ
jgi:hypothetical protein